MLFYKSQQSIKSIQRTLKKIGIENTYDAQKQSPTQNVTLNFWQL
jgi:hypothetical protein